MSVVTELAEHLPEAAVGRAAPLGRTRHLHTSARRTSDERRPSSWERSVRSGLTSGRRSRWRARSGGPAKDLRRRPWHASGRCHASGRSRDPCADRRRNDHLLRRSRRDCAASDCVARMWPCFAFHRVVVPNVVRLGRVLPIGVRDAAGGVGGAFESRNGARLWICAAQCTCISSFLVRPSGVHPLIEDASIQGELI